QVALDQVRGGANLLDVNMDADLLDSESAMVRYLKLIATEPEITRIPVMVDSSKPTVIEAGLKCLQGKGVANSISLKGGEESFLDQARLVRRHGAAAVVMAFDEVGQADTFERKVEISSRAYKLLTEKAGFEPEDIIFDPNILPIATGIEEHAAYAKNFIDATREIKKRFPRVHVSGGVSNLSSRSAATTACARRSIPRFSTTRSGRGWTWASSTRVSWWSTRTSPRICSSSSRMSSSTGGPTRQKDWSSLRSPCPAPGRSARSILPGAKARSRSASSTQSSTARSNT